MTAKELESFYDQYASRLYRYFFYKVLNREHAEDLTSKTFLQFAKSIRLEKRIDSPKAFLFGIANHVFLTFLQEKYKRGKEVSIDEELENSLIYSDDAYLEKHDVVDLLEALLPRVPEKQAQVLRFRFVDKLSISEIAAKLEKDDNYVSTTQKRGLATLRVLLRCTDNDTNMVEDE
jgi:RNA polymerase sigma-70 factor (ECF subfamily)